MKVLRRSLVLAFLVGLAGACVATHWENTSQPGRSLEHDAFTCHQDAQTSTQDPIQ